MEVFEQYLAKIDHVDHRNRVEEILRWVVIRSHSYNRKSNGIHLCLPVTGHLSSAFLQPNTM